MLSFLILIFGLILLVFSGDYLVRGAVALAEKLGINPLIIGLTIVAFGTSAPELFVSIEAAFDEAAGIALGNVIGSNIANVLLVMGAPALIAAMSCQEKGIGISLAFMMAFTLALIWFMSSGVLGRFEGIILLAMLVAYLGYQFHSAKKQRKGCDGEPLQDIDYHDEVDHLPAENWRIGLFLVLGLIGLPIGADFTVDGAEDIARMFGISEAAIGLTIVAIGTSLPELVTALMAAIRRSGAVALGNVVGSNIFNIGLILGTTSLLYPLRVDPRLMQVDVWVMLLASLIVVALAVFCKPVNRIGGALLLAGYVTYIISVF